MALLEVKNLTTRFHTRDGVIHAVEDVSFSVEAGQALGIVGESGSGKSVTCYSILGLIPTPPGRVHAGQAIFDGIDLLKTSEKQLRELRGNKISMIFQDPMTCLNPYLKIAPQLTEPLIHHRGYDKKKALLAAIDALREVGIPDPENRINAYPHEFSGGMRQRVMIAMALITKPELLICDEPTTALDVTIQKQVLDLIKELQQKYGTAVVMITHDLGVVNQVCDYINVMYAGRIVESANRDTLFSKPLHAYTRSLLKSIPANHKKNSSLFTIPGLPPDPTNPSRGCSFQPRNIIGQQQLCLTSGIPKFVEKTANHWVQDCPGCLAQ